MALECSCGQIHIIETEVAETDENDEEYDKHTDEFKTAYEEHYDELSDCNSTEGEMLMEKWIQENHPLLCCDHRHKCKEYS